MDVSDNCKKVDIVNFLPEVSIPVKPIGCVVKVFLASLPITEIRDVSIPVAQRIRLQEKNSEDIEEYTCHLRKKPAFNYYSDGKREEIKDYIFKHADGVFLWVHVVSFELEKYSQKGKSQGELFKFPKSLPEEIEGYYEHML